MRMLAHGRGRRRLRGGCPAFVESRQHFSATARASSCWPASLRALARSPIVAERLPSSVAALAWSGVASSVSQGWPPAFSTSASQWPMASRRMGMAWVEAPQSFSTSPKVTDRQRQLKRGIELRGVAEALDEGLELVHRPLRIALGEERPGVLPLVVGGFFREALPGSPRPSATAPRHRVRGGGRTFPDSRETCLPASAATWSCRRPRPSGRRCGSSPPRGPGSPGRRAIGSPSAPCPAPA